MPPIRRLSWAHFNAAIAVLASRQFRGQCLYGVPRGGLPLAVALSHATGMPLTPSPCFGMVVVDDIADTGRTLEALLGQFPGSSAATWVRRDTCADLPNLRCAMTISGPTWIVFPWEDAGKAEAEREAYNARR